MIGSLLLVTSVCAFAPVPGEVPTPTAIVVDSRKRGKSGLYLLKQAELLKSKDVLAAALRRRGIAELKVVKEQSDPIRWLEKTVQVDADTEKFVLRIRVPDGSAEARAALANALADALVEESARQFRAPIEKKISAQLEKQAALAKTLNELQNELRNGLAQKPPIEEIRQTQLNTRITDVSEENKSVERELKSLREEVADPTPLAVSEKAREP